MLTETYNHLKDHGYARGEEQVDRAKLADACRDLLLEQPVATAEDTEIQDKGLIVSELRFRLLGEAGSEDVERELDAILGPLTGPSGAVQAKLENGYVLCSAPVTRKLSNNGEGTITLKRAARFVTENADLIERYYWLPAQARIMQAVAGLNHRFELSIRRRPELAVRKPVLVGNVHMQFQLEMPAEDES